MSYTDDAVKAKLSALNESQEAIVTVAQWIMFHRKYAARTAELWLQRLKDSVPLKRLNLIYLANEVVQQSKARKKVDFLIAFAPIMTDATAIAYKGATIDVQQKIRRVVEVWRQRGIFDPPIQQQVEAKIDEIDRTRGGGKRPALGGSLFSAAASSAPPEYQAILTSQASITKSEVLAKPAVTNSNDEYYKQIDPSIPSPPPPVHAARLSALLKTLANAEGAVADSIKARKALVEGLEKILAKNKEEMTKEESQLYELNSRKTEIEAKKREVEESIMRGLQDQGSNGGQELEPQRPDAEPLTPPMPPIESITPIGTPITFVTSTEITSTEEQLGTLAEPEPLALERVADGSEETPVPLVSVLSVDLLHGPDSMNGAYEPMVKRRKVAGAAPEEDFAEFADDGMGIDADVEAMLAP